MELRIASTWDGEPIPEDEAVDVSLQAGPQGLTVEVSAPLHGDPVPPGRPGPTERLWEHEVVELFIAGPGSRYTEVELGPWGHHLLLLLDGVRNPVAERLPLEYEARVVGQRWHGRALLPWDVLPPRPHRLNACAIHGLGGSRRYLSWRLLPGGTPDFHQPDQFAPWEGPGERRDGA